MVSFFGLCTLDSDDHALQLLHAAPVDTGDMATNTDAGQVYRPDSAITNGAAHSVLSGAVCEPGMCFSNF